MNTPQQEYSILHDSFGRSLPYLIKYAKQPTANTRTLFIFHGRDIASYSKFYDENWNIVCPLDHYGLDKKGSWFLGEHGDFFIKDLVIELIELVKSKTGSNRLYFWGSSMGGYAAILYGILFSAEAVYANVPFIKLTDCQIDLSEFRKPLDFVFGYNPLPEHRYLLDLTQFITEMSNKEIKMPVFFINNTRFHHYRQLDEQIFYFINTLEELDINYYLEITPQQGHVLIKNVAQSVALFERYEEMILTDFSNRKKHISDNKILYKNSFYFENDTTLELLFSIQCDERVDKNQCLYTVTINPEKENYFKLNELFFSKALNKHFNYISLQPNVPNNKHIIVHCPQRTHVVLTVQEWFCTGKITITNVQEDKVNYLSQI